MLDAGLVKNSVSYYLQTHDYNPALVFAGTLDVVGQHGFGASVAGCGSWPGVVYIAGAGIRLYPE